MNRQSAFAVACAVCATAALGVVASPAGAFKLADGATLYNLDGGNSITLDQLLGDNFKNGVQVDDKIFHNFVFRTACLGMPCPTEDSPANPVAPVEPVSISVSASQGTSGPGLLFNDFWFARSGHAIDIALGFDVHVVEGSGKLINDVHLSFIPDFARNLGLDSGQVRIAESVTDLEGTSLINGFLTVDNLSSTTDVDISDWAFLNEPTDKVRVLKDIRIVGADEITGEGEDAGFSILIQEFSNRHT